MIFDLAMFTLVHVVIISWESSQDSSSSVGS